MYTCNICKVKKEDAEFYKVKGTTLGHDKTCKECRKVIVKKLQRK